MNVEELLIRLTPRVRRKIARMGLRGRSRRGAVAVPKYLSHAELVALEAELVVEAVRRGMADVASDAQLRRACDHLIRVECFRLGEAAADHWASMHR